MADEATVYVVEDDEASRELMKDLFESVDLNVVTFNSGNDFLDALPVESPGCILLDVRMPGISGLDLQTKLSSQPSSLPIIIVTAHGDTQMAVRAMKEGAFDFVEKPINNQLLLETVDKAINERRAGPPGRYPPAIGEPDRAGTGRAGNDRQGQNQQTDRF